MAWVAVAIAGTAIVGAAVSSNASNNAVEAQTNAANQSNATQQQQYNQTRTDNAPWRAAGETALGQLSTGTAAGGQFNRSFSMADFQQDPGYAFRMAEGQKALERSGAARGMTLSGAQSKALTAYGQGMGSQEYGNAYSRFNNDNTTQFNRLASMAGLGQTANASNAAAGTNMANNVSNTQMGLGNAQGAAALAQGNAVTGAINSGVNGYNQYNMWNSMQAQASPQMSNAAAYSVPDMPARGGY